LATAAQKREYQRDHRGDFASIAQGVQIMNLASSSLYYKPKIGVAGRAKTDADLRDWLERIQGEFPGLGKQLRREGIRLNDKRIGRVQRKYH
jgi:hypothetical protein